jgi:biofilm protein TabA
MIWGDLSKWNQEKSAFHPVLQRSVQFLLDHDFNKMASGKYSIQGDEIYATVQDWMTSSPKERKSENHRKFIDIQYLALGEEEVVGVARTSERNSPIEERLEEGDYALFEEVEGENEITLRPGMFLVFFPDDLHRPVCSHKGVFPIKKVVIKIDKRLLL